MKKRARGKDTVTVSRARALLGSLVREVSGSTHGKVALSVHGEIKAYVVGAERMEKLEAREGAARHARARPPGIAGTLEVVSDLEQGSREASLELELAALRSWDRAMKA